MSEVTSVNGKTGAVVLKAAEVEAVPTSEVGQPSGVASLNSSGKLPEAQLPSSVESSRSVAVTGEHEPTGAGEAVFANATAGAFAIPLPAPAAGNTGWRFTIVNTSTNTNIVTVEPKAGEILGAEGDGTPTKKLKLGKGQVYYAITVISDGSNYHVI